MKSLTHRLGCQLVLLFPFTAELLKELTPFSSLALSISLSQAHSDFRPPFPATALAESFCDSRDCEEHSSVLLLHDLPVTFDVVDSFSVRNSLSFGFPLAPFLVSSLAPFC